MMEWEHWGVGRGEGRRGVGDDVGAGCVCLG